MPAHARGFAGDGNPGVVPHAQPKAARRTVPEAWPETENDSSLANACVTVSDGAGANKWGVQPHNMLRCQSTVDLAGFGGFSRLYEPEPHQSVPSPVACRHSADDQRNHKRREGLSEVTQARAPLGEITNTANMAPVAVEKVQPAQTAPALPNEEQYVTEYASDVLKSMLHRQMLFMPRPDYMAAQRDLNAKMRSILNDWLFEVHKKYGLRRETLFLSVSITDRYLSRRSVARDRLQLIGVAATLVAAKFEEIHPPEVGDLIYVTACTYARQDILDTEMSILTALGFQVAGPTAAHFLSHFQAAYKTSDISGPASCPGRSASARRPLEGSAWDSGNGELAWYILELALLEIRMIRHAPSHLAASAVLLSNAISGHAPAWPEPLARASGHPEGSLRACVAELRDLLTAAPAGELQAVQNHYRRIGRGLLGERQAGGGSRRP